MDCLTGQKVFLRKLPSKYQQILEERIGLWSEQTQQEDKELIEVLLGVCWAISYALIVMGGYWYRHEKLFFMPLISGALNFAWEIHALCSSGGYWAHIVWLLLDCAILLQNLYFLSSVKKRFLYSACVIAAVAALYGVFSVKSFDGMLLSSFVIDVIMAVEYLAVITKLSPKMRILIGIFRLLGDAFAWISNLRFSLFVCILGIVILSINIFYISYAAELSSKKNKPISVKNNRHKAKN